MIVIDWNFPSNGGGLIRGVSEAGIQTFTGKEISSLAREVCQNSLDAALNENSAVTVEFQLHKIYTINIPGYSSYRNILTKCRDFWIDNAKAKNFLDKAIAQLSLPKTFVLQISDYNTTGLSEPFNLRAQGGWNALTKIDGGATKTGDSAGSFGIGKNAPFANSFYRLVFYRTFNIKAERAAQGMSRLVSFQRSADDISAGVGYYGETEKNLPVRKIDELENISKRFKTGTDIFIYGFNGDELWRENIFLELFENFLVAIHRDKLRVKIQTINIDKDNLGYLLRKYEDKLQKASNYYRALTGDGVKIFEEDFHGMGKLKLRVLLDPKANLNRKILVVRKSGMKLFEQDRISRTLSFTGILELEGQKLNEFFREMETPQHDKWEYGRYEKNPKLAKKYVEELRDWVRETIQKLGEENISDEVNVEGLSHMLDFDDSAITGGSETSEESLDNPVKPDDFPQELSKENTSDKNKNNSKSKRTTGNITSNGTSPAMRTLTGTRKRRTLAEHRGEENPDGKDIIWAESGRKINCDKIRVIKVGEKNYRLILRVPRNISSGHLEIFAIGENNSGEKLSVLIAISADSNSEVQAAGDKIDLKNLRADTDAKISFKLQDNRNYALGVAVYED